MKNKALRKTSKATTFLYFFRDTKLRDDIIYYELYCLNSSETIVLSLNEVIHNLSILSALPSSHGCFFGFEYAKTLKSSLDAYFIHQKLLENDKLDAPVKNFLYYKNRNGFLGFKENYNELIEMDPLEMMQSQTLISNFSSMDAFYIGLYGGLQLDKYNTLNRNLLPKLTKKSLNSSSIRQRIVVA